eukprot:356660-Chlamydomonas_euryale.AAC.4
MAETLRKSAKGEKCGKREGRKRSGALKRLRRCARVGAGKGQGALCSLRDLAHVSGLTSFSSGLSIVRVVAATVSPTVTIPGWAAL